MSDISRTNSQFLINQQEVETVQYFRGDVKIRKGRKCAQTAIDEVTFIYGHFLHIRNN